MSLGLVPLDWTEPVPGVDVDELQEALKDQFEPLAECLLGPRNRVLSNRRQARWGRRGSVAALLRGAKRGVWFSHEAEVGGGPLQLIRFARSCSFREAVRWGTEFAGLSGSTSPSYDERRQRRQERERRRAEQEAEKVAEEQRHIARAWDLWTHTVPIAGTIGDRYLTVTRGIPRPPAGWPGAVRFLPGNTVTLQEQDPDGRDIRRMYPIAGALVVAATQGNGTLQAVQRIYLTSEAENLRRSDGSKVKLTLGVLEGAAVRLPGPLIGPLLYAEGPETGLSIWAATGYETHVALGSCAHLAGHEDRALVLCRDDDPRGTPADKGVSRTVMRWRDEDCFPPAIITPWPVRRWDSSDFNDVMKVGGPAAVKARIDAVVTPSPPPPHRVPVDQARSALDQAVRAFLEQALAWNAATYVTGRPTEPPAPPVLLLPDDPGIGKSEAARRHAVRTLAEGRVPDGGSLVIFVPTHRLGDEQARSLATLAELHDVALQVEVWRGRTAQNPYEPGQPMCRNLDAVREAQALMLDVPHYVCRSCRYADTCAYLIQGKRRANLWIAPHQLLFEQKPEAIGDPMAVIIDENPLGAALDGAGGTTLPLDVLLREDTVPDQAVGLMHGVAAQRLTFLRRLVFRTLVEQPDGPLSRETLVAVGLTKRSAVEGHQLEWRTKIEPELQEEMTVAERQAALRTAKCNADLRRRIDLWRALEALLAEDGPAASGWVALETVSDQNGRTIRQLRLKRRRDVTLKWQVPTLLLDATPRIELLRHIWSGMTVIAEVRGQMPHQRIRQVIDRSFALSMLDVDSAKTPAETEHRVRNLHRVHAVICREARRFAPAKVLLVAQQTVERALVSLGNLPQNLEVVHHNSVRGIDRYRDFRAMILLGRTLPSHLDAVRMAEALTGVAIPAVPYRRADAWREREGYHMQRWLELSEGWRHPDPVVEAIRWSACEAELVQLIGRLRGVNRTADCAADILVMTDVPIPLQIHSCLREVDLDPSPADRMLAAGGVALWNAGDAGAAYPDLWPTREAAKKAQGRHRGRLATNLYDSSFLQSCLQPLQRAEYQRAGSGYSPADAWFDPALIPDLTSWLTEKLGPLAWCRVEKNEGERPDMVPVQEMGDPAVKDLTA